MFGVTYLRRFLSFHNYVRSLWDTLSSVAVLAEIPQVGHPKHYLFLLSKKLFAGSKNPKIKQLNFEKHFTDSKPVADSLV